MISKAPPSKDHTPAGQILHHVRERTTVARDKTNPEAATVGAACCSPPFSLGRRNESLCRHAKVIEHAQHYGSNKSEKNQ